MLDLFINYDGNIDDIVKEIRELLGIEQIKKTDEFGAVYMFRFLDIEFVLYGDHELEDDCGIAFSDYNYQLQILKLYSGEKYKSYENIYNNVATYLMEKLSYAFNSNVMLVDNLQSIVASTVPTT